MKHDLERDETEDLVRNALAQCALKGIALGAVLGFIAGVLFSAVTLK